MEKEKRNPQPIDLISLIQLMNVEITSFNVSDSNGKIKKENIKRFNFNFNFSMKSSLKDEVVILFPNIDFLFFNEDDIHIEECSAHVSALFNFKIKNLKDLVEENEDGHSLKMNPHLTANLIGIIYSTLRGMLLEKAKNTILETIILPVINPLQLVK